MEFVDKFVRVPIKTFSQNHKDLTGKEELEDVWARVDPNQICEYFSVFENGQDAVSINLNSGHCFVVYLPIEDFENVLNSWQNKNQ